jgi:hypothetical protein
MGEMSITESDGKPSNPSSKDPLKGSDVKCI